MRLGDDQIVDVEIVIVLGIGDRRLQTLAHIARDPLARELEISKRRRHFLAADQLRHQIELLRTNPQHAGNRLRLIFGEAALALFLAHRISPQLLAGVAGAAAGAAAPGAAAGAPGTAGPARFALRSEEWP